MLTWANCPAECDVMSSAVQVSGHRPKSWTHVDLMLSAQWPQLLLREPERLHHVNELQLCSVLCWQRRAGESGHQVLDLQVNREFCQTAVNPLVTAAQSPSLTHRRAERACSYSIILTNGLTAGPAPFHSHQVDDFPLLAARSSQTGRADLKYSEAELRFTARRPTVMLLRTLKRNTMGPDHSWGLKLSGSDHTQCLKHLKTYKINVMSSQG